MVTVPPATLSLKDQHRRLSYQSPRYLPNSYRFTPPPTPTILPPTQQPDIFLNTRPPGRQQVYNITRWDANLLSGKTSLCKVIIT